MVKGDRNGYVFCAVVADRVYLRFVPSDAEQPIVTEVGTCLRFLECTEETPRVLSEEMALGAYAAWQAARENILDAWTFETDPANLQPKVRRLGREVAEFLRANPPSDVESARLHRALDAVEAPWSMREEKQLRAAWEREFLSRTEKAQHLIAEVERIGVEPHHAPEPLPPIEGDDIHLVCWLAIVAASSATRA